MLFLLLLTLMDTGCDPLQFPHSSITKISSGFPNYLYVTLADTHSQADDPLNNGPDESDYNQAIPTHYVYSPEDFYFDENDEASPLKPTGTGKPLGTRTPVILIHGWQGSNGLTDPEALHKNEHQADQYWANLIKFFEHLDPGREHYKLYLYRYPSYKHVTYNASIFKSLISPANGQQRVTQLLQLPDGWGDPKRWRHFHRSFHGYHRYPSRLRRTRHAP